jgi:hypothetical protein
MADRLESKMSETFGKFKKIGLAVAAGSSLMLGTAYADNGDGLADDDSGQRPFLQNDNLTTSEMATLNTLSKVSGVFAFDQTSLSTNAEVKRALNDSAEYICGSQLIGSRVVGLESSLDWRISVGGTVDNQFTATLSELAKEGKTRAIMGCSCAGNRAGGLGTVNADIAGITLASIMDRAGVSDEANTVVFTSQDGYEVALPLTYLKYRHSILAYGINGAELQDSVGGSNQLWLGSTSALYFARDIEGIRFEVRVTPPPAPGTEDAGVYANIPGIGITYAGEQK